MAVTCICGKVCKSRSGFNTHARVCPQEKARSEAFIAAIEAPAAPAAAPVELAPISATTVSAALRRAGHLPVPNEPGREGLKVTRSYDNKHVSLNAALNTPSASRRMMEAAKETLEAAGYTVRTHGDHTLAEVTKAATGRERKPDLVSDVAPNTTDAERAAAIAEALAEIETRKAADESLRAAAITAAERCDDADHFDAYPDPDKTWEHVQAHYPVILPDEGMAHTVPSTEDVRAEVEPQTIAEIIAGNDIEIPADETGTPLRCGLITRTVKRALRDGGTVLRLVKVTTKPITVASTYNGMFETTVYYKGYGDAHGAKRVRETLATLAGRVSWGSETHIGSQYITLITSPYVGAVSMGYAHDLAHLDNGQHEGRLAVATLLAVAQERADELAAAGWEPPTGPPMLLIAEESGREFDSEAHRARLRDRPRRT